METVTLAHDGSARQYLWHGAAGAPLLVALHGTGGTAAWADDEAGWSAFARREGFALAVPDALPPDPAKPPKFLTNPQRWNDGAVASGQWPVAREEVDDVGFLTAVVAEAVRRGADPRRVFVTGFSNGAGMAFRFAAERADLVAAVAPVAGHFRVADPRPARPVPTLFVIGTADPLVPVAGGPIRTPWGRTAERQPVAVTLSKWATAIGCSPTPDVVSDIGGVREEVYAGPVEFRAVYVEGLGHHWPGGKGQLAERFGGNAGGPFDANAALGAFVRRHALSNA